MKAVIPVLAAALNLCSGIAPLVAQDPGDIVVPSADSRILLRYATFDPLRGVPRVGDMLRSSADGGLWIVQFHAAPTDRDRDLVGQHGGRIHGYLPHDAWVVRMASGGAAALAGAKQVRWIGAYEPAYRLEPELLGELLGAGPLPVRAYNLVMSDKRRDKETLEQRITAMGGKVLHRHPDSLLFTVELDGVQLLAASRLDEVLWIDRWTPSSDDMNNARVQGGANAVETAAGYTGNGVRGHVYEGAEASHPDFDVALTNVRSGGEAMTHGHCTAGIVFGNGNSAAQARGMAPDARGFYTTKETVTAGWSRNQVINDVVNVHDCMFTTASWGAAQTTAYTSVSADADDIVFDHRIPWTNSMANLGDQRVRPEAWAKNVISVGAFGHGDNSTAADDSWLAGDGSSRGSIGPASDGRNKPDLSGYYDLTWTSDRSGTAGYNTAAGVAGNSYTNFGGTSGATPMVAGHNALAIQMFTDGIFGNPLPGAPTVGNRFLNRPRAQTLKALMIATAIPLAPQATDNRREHTGWGMPNVNNLYTRRDRMAVVAEDRPITQGATHTHMVNVRNGETALKVVMTYLDLPGNPAAALQRVNDLTLRVVHPDGTTAYWGNVGLVGASQANVSSTGGSANTIDTVECVFLTNPTPGNWTIQVSAPTIAIDAHTATPATDATYALVANGAILLSGSGCARHIPDASTLGTGNFIPFGTVAPTPIQTTFVSNNSGSAGGAVYFDVTPAANLFVTGFDLNASAADGNPVTVDVYTRSGTYAGNETNPAGWTVMSTGHGTSAGPDAQTHIELNEPILMLTGTHGMAIVARNFGHRYTNGTGSNQSYSDGSIALAFGSATNAPFSAPVNSPRVANLVAHYRTDTSAWTNQLYQTVLRRSDLGSAGTIRGLAFSAESTGVHFNRELRIRMSHVPVDHVLSTTFASNLPSPVTVLSQYDHSWHVVGDQWTEVGLEAPFDYNGTSDVVVEVLARGNHSTVPAAFNRGDGTVPRVASYGFGFGSIPTVATVNDSSGQRIRVNFGCAVGSEYGSSCGPLRAAHWGTPNRGGFAWWDLSNAVPSNIAILALGFNLTGPIPTSLDGYGFTGCHAFHDYVSTLVVSTSASGFATHGASVPNNPILDGVQVKGQWFQLDATQPGGVTVSNYVNNLVGIDP